ncbi:MAG: hypothetical protein CK425_03055 [Parachlamydia sp.]|nr:MAG: hypothetical protein CK425_03055 [Parachlamydia sp.]
MIAKRSGGQLVVLWITVLLSLPFLFQMGSLLMGHPVRMSGWLQLILTSVIQFICGLGLYQQALKSWQSRSLTVEAFLVGVITLVFFYNANVVINGWPLFTYFEVNVFTVVQTLLGQWLLSQAHHRQDATRQFSSVLFQVLADKVTLVFLLVVSGLSLMAILGWWLLAGDFYRGLLNGISIWIIACPASLGLAIPTILAVGMRVAQRLGSIFQLELSETLYKKIRQNLFFTLIFPLMGMPFALLGWLNPLLVNATLAMSFFAIMANALLLYFWLPKHTQGV